MTEKTDDLNSKVARWIKEQGYPLEMAVAKAFRREGFMIIQSEFYDDPETGKSREIDVCAWKQREIHDILVRVNFCIECKLAKDKPWVIFTSSDTRLADTASIVQRSASTLGHALLESIYRRNDIQKLSIFLLPKRPGYGLTQAFISGEDIPYAAFMTAAKAAVAESKNDNEGAHYQGPICGISFPVVVIDGRLFECYLNDSGEVTTEEIQIGTLISRSHIIGMPHTIVQIVTLPAIDDFLYGAREISLALFERCEDELVELSNKIPEDAPRWPKRILLKPSPAKKG